MERHDQLVALVARMLALHRQRRVARTPHAQSVLQAQIDATDRQIDRLVYGLYGLTVASASIFARSTTQRRRKADVRSGDQEAALNAWNEVAGLAGPKRNDRIGQRLMWQEQGRLV